MRLKWKLTGAFAIVVVVVAVVVGLQAQAACRSRLKGSLTDSLVMRCRTIGRIINDSDTIHVAERLRQAAEGTKMELAVFGTEGNMIADTAAEQSSKADVVPAEVRQAMEAGQGRAIRTPVGSNSRLLYVARQMGTGGRRIIRAGVPMTGMERRLDEFRQSILVSSVVVGIIGIVFGMVVAHRISASLDRLADTAERIGEGELDTRVRVSGTEQVRRIADGLNAITAGHRQVEADLRQQAAHLRAVLSQMADGVIVVDADENVNVFNEAAGQLLAVDRETAPGNPLVEVTLQYDLVQLVRRSLRLGTATQQEIVTIERTEKQVAAAAAAVEDAEGQLTGAVLTLRDVTQLLRLRQIRQDFVMNASHELRTPVSAIRSLAETLRDGAIDDEQAAPRFLEQIVSNTERLSNIVEDLMELTRLETGAAPERKRVSVRWLAEAATERIMPQAKHRQVEVSVDVDEGMEVWCCGEDVLTALTNLVDNAVKYAAEGGNVQVSAELVNRHVEIAVCDDGPGIPEDERERVFNRFYRVDKARSRKLGGTGLGLSIVKHAVQSNDGRVWVEEADMGGARVVMSLPIYSADGAGQADG